MKDGPIVIGARLRSVLQLERAISHKLRHRLLGLAAFLTLLLLAVFLVGYLAHGAIVFWMSRLLGAVLIVLTIWLSLFLLELYFRSHYYNYTQSFYTALTLLYDCHENKDAITHFLSHPIGHWLLLRLGILELEQKTYLESRMNDKTSIFLCRDLDAAHVETLSSLLLALFEKDNSFATFLRTHEITGEDIVGASEWYLKEEERSRNSERWWSRDGLSRIPAIARDFAYGHTYILNRFGRDLSTEALVSSVDHSLESRSIDLERLLLVMERSTESNALLVGEQGAGMFELVLDFARLVASGQVPPPMDRMRVVLFDSMSFIAYSRKRASIGSDLLNVMTEAAVAGNVILVIEEFPNLIESARLEGTDIIALMDPFLSRPILPIIALSDADGFHASLEQDASLMRRFEKLPIREPNEHEVTLALFDEVRMREAHFGLFYTYQGLREIAQGAKRYFPGAVLPDKAVDILEEVTTFVFRAGGTMVDRDEVLKIIEKKTGIPLGKMASGEKEKLLNLESILHERVIGQEEGISAIARTMRRARSGVTNEKRPFGSFLFLGPTGVGKTETAKALAAIFFGSEDRMIRLDMSEYNDDNALDRLLGTFESEKPGVLSSLLRANPYAVLLLDELEKGSREVQQLFLQIIDEGEFKDARGKTVNARTTLIIATSNAVADSIYSIVLRKEKPEDHREELIAEIVERNIFAPELLNRFDAMVFYRTLTQAELGQVANLMLKSFAARLKKKGLTLVINDVLLRHVIKHGYDPKFGARPMRRAIQDRIEDLIARRLISGNIKRGDVVALTEEDLV